jgi:hypothetical protein
VAWLAGDDERAVAEARAGIDASGERADPWLLGSLRRWIHLCGNVVDVERADVPTTFDLEIGGQWEAAAREWGRAWLRLRGGVGPTRRRHGRGEVGA